MSQKLVSARLQDTVILTLKVQIYLFAVLVIGLFFRSSTMCYSITAVACLEPQAIAMFAIGL